LSRDPSTPEEWQEAADMAEFLLLLDGCRQYGLVDGGPEAHVERCCRILTEAARRGIFPSGLVPSREEGGKR
jgi:hypothetical protein